MPKRGCFISLEGLEGVGKTTNLEFIKSQLQNAGVEPVVTREPGGTKLGEGLRHLLLHAEHEVCAQTELMMMTASRKQHVIDVIEPALANGSWVLCDRFADASFAYQGGGRELGANTVKALHELMGIHIQPDLTLLLDMPVLQGLERMSARGKPDRIEKEALGFFERARDAYLAQAAEQPERVKIVDASVALEQVQAQIARLLEPVLHSA